MGQSDITIKAKNFSLMHFFINSKMTFSTILNATAVCSSAVFSVAPSIFIKHPLQSGSLANVHLNYGSKPTNGEISLSFGDCESGKVVYDIVQMNINQALRPEKFVWYLPEDAHTTSGCLFAKHHASDDVFAKSERYTPTKKRETRLFGGLTHLHFDAARYHHNNGTHNHSHATAKNASKYSNIKYEMLAITKNYFVLV